MNSAIPDGCHPRRSHSRSAGTIFRPRRHVPVNGQGNSGAGKGRARRPRRIAARPEAVLSDTICRVCSRFRHLQDAICILCSSLFRSARRIRCLHRPKTAQLQYPLSRRMPHMPQALLHRMQIEPRTRPNLLHRTKIASGQPNTSVTRRPCQVVNWARASYSRRSRYSTQNSGASSISPPSSGTAIRPRPVSATSCASSA